LQIIAPYDLRSTDKQNTDKAVFELKRLSRDLKIPVIGISSLNRENYNCTISMTAFKESGAIEYSSDVLIGLQFEKMSEILGKEDVRITAESINILKRADPRKIELKILKNRNGATGDSIKYDYYPKFNYFHEKGKKELYFNPLEKKSGAMGKVKR
jgi:replicative DNA helicase